MADRAEVSKSLTYALTGASGTSQSSKVVMYVILSPGAPGENLNRNASVSSQIVRKP